MSTMLGIKKEFSKNFEEESETYLNSLQQFEKIQLEKNVVNKGINTPLVDEIKGNNLKDWTSYTYQKYFTFQSRQYLSRTDSEIARESSKQNLQELEKVLKDVLINDKDNESLNVNISSSELDLSKVISDVNKMVSEWISQPVLKSTFEDLNIIEVDQVYRDFLLSSDKPVVTSLLQLLEKLENDKASLKINNQDFGLLKPSLISEGIEELKSMTDRFNKNQYNSIIREINSLNSLIEKIKDSFDKTIKNEGEKIWSFSNDLLSFWENIKKKSGEGEITKRKIVNLFKDANSKLIPKFTDYWNDNVASHIKKGKKKKNADSFMKDKTDEEILEYMDKTFEDFFNNMALYNKKWRDEVILKIIDQQRDLIKEIIDKLVSSLNLEKERLTKSIEKENGDSKEQNELLKRCEKQLGNCIKAKENWEGLVKDLINTIDEQQKKLEEQYNEIIAEYKKSINLTGRLEKVNKKDFMKQIKAVENQSNSNRSKDLLNELFALHDFDEPILETLICLLQEGEWNEKQFAQTKYASIQGNQKYNELKEKRKDILTRCQNEIMAGFIYMGIKLDSMFIEESCRMSETTLTFQKLGISVSASKKNKKKKNKKKKSASASASANASTNVSTANSEEDLTEPTVDTPEPESVETPVEVVEVKSKKTTTPAPAQTHVKVHTQAQAPAPTKAEITENLIKQSIAASEKIIKKESENAEKKQNKMLFTDIVNKPAPPPVEKKTTNKKSTTSPSTPTLANDAQKHVKPTVVEEKKTKQPTKKTVLPPAQSKPQTKPQPKPQQEIKTEPVKQKEEKKEQPKSKQKEIEVKSNQQSMIEEKLKEVKEEKPEEKQLQEQSQEKPQEKSQEEPQEEPKEQPKEQPKEAESKQETKYEEEEKEKDVSIPKSEFINENVFTNGASQKEPSEEFNLFKPHDDLLAPKTTIPLNMSNISFTGAPTTTTSTSAASTTIPITTSGFSPFVGNNNNNQFNIAAALLNSNNTNSTNAGNLSPSSSFFNMPVDPQLAFLLAGNEAAPVTPPFIDMGQSKEQLILLINHLQNENQQLKLTYSKLLQQAQQITNQKCQEVSNMAIELNHLKLQYIEKSHQCSTLEDELKIQKMINQEKVNTIENLKVKMDGLLHHRSSSGLGGRANSEGGSGNNNIYRPPKMRNNNATGNNAGGGFHHYNKNATGDKSGSFSSGRSGSYNNKFSFSKSGSNSGSHSGSKPPGFEHNGWRKQTSKSSSHGHGYHHPNAGYANSAMAHKKEEEDNSIPTSNIFASLNDDEHDSDSILSESQENIEGREVEQGSIEVEGEKVEGEEEEKVENKAMVQEPEPESGSEPKQNQNQNPEFVEANKVEGIDAEVSESVTKDQALKEAENETATAPAVPVVPEPEPMPEIEATTTSAAELLG